MKFIKKIFCIFILALIFIPNVKAEEKVNLYLFHSELCSTCAAERAYLDEIKENYPYLNIVLFEVTQSKENSLLLKEVRSKLKNKELTTPYTVIGTTGITGFNEIVEGQIKETIEKYHDMDHVDITYNTINNIDEDYEIIPVSGKYNVPLFGDIDPKKVSLPLISVVIGFIDGFNPCAMWVLIFLISMLFNMKNKKRMWILGITFLLTSALIYMAFMLAWLEVAISLNQIAFVRIIIALIALFGAGINLSSYFKSLKKNDGCEVVDNNKRKKIIERIKKFTHEKNFALAMLGIIGLAISVNLIELACSSGLPLIFTQILALNDLSSLQYFLYILLYILFFLIDDIVIFVIAMVTLNVTGISSKYTKYSHLIGGIIMLLIGLLMIFKPEWLMFNF